MQASAYILTEERLQDIRQQNRLRGFDPPQWDQVYPLDRGAPLHRLQQTHHTVGCDLTKLVGLGRRHVELDVSNLKVGILL